MKYVLPKPPRFASEQANAIPPAAAEPFRNVEGSAHTTGIAAAAPALTSENSTTVASVPCGPLAAMVSAAAATTNGTTICQRRSRVRSELTPHHSVPITATAFGTAISQPIWYVSLTPVSRRIDGSQKLTAYKPSS